MAMQQQEYSDIFKQFYDEKFLKLENSLQKIENKLDNIVDRLDEKIEKLENKTDKKLEYCNFKEENFKQGCKETHEKVNFKFLDKSTIIWLLGLFFIVIMGLSNVIYENNNNIKENKSSINSNNISIENLKKIEEKDYIN